MGTKNVPQTLCCALVFLLCFHYVLYGMDGSRSLSTHGVMPQVQPYNYRSFSVGISSSRLENAAANVTALLKEEDTRTVLIMFHALPKCGSRTLLTLAKMGEEFANGLLTVDANLTVLPRDMFYDEDFAREYILRHLERLSKPLFVYTHARFVDLRKSLGKTRYVGLIRDPLSRLVSSYYYRRNRDGTELTEKEKLWRSTLTNLSNKTFDECVQHNGTDCTGPFSMISTIAHFCGPDKRCSTNKTWALGRAKRNVVHYYDVIGIMEDYTSFVQVVEAKFSPAFSGATNNYILLQNQPHGVASMKTQKKVPPSEETQKIMTERMQYDYQFYNFVKDRFYKQKQDLGLG